MQENKKQYVVYVVHFSDGRLKIGISSQVKERMKYYAQEGRRNGVQYVSWWACKSFDRKSDALLVEKMYCSVCKEYAIPHHREWFYGDSNDYVGLTKLVKKTREFIANEAGECVQSAKDHWNVGYFDLRAA